MPRTHRLPDRLGALAGFAFAVLLFFGVAVVDPLRHATDQELRAWWTDSGLLRDSVVSTYLRLGGAACFLVFLAQLRARLQAADPACSWLDLVVAPLCLLMVALGAGPLATPLVLVWTVGVSTQLFSARGGRSTATEAPPRHPHGDAHRLHRRPPPLLPLAPTERRR